MTDLTEERVREIVREEMGRPLEKTPEQEEHYRTIEFLSRPPVYSERVKQMVKDVMGDDYVEPWT